MRVLHQPGEPQLIGLVGELQHLEIRLDDVLGRRQDIADHVLAVDDLVVDGAIDLDLGDHVVVDAEFPEEILETRSRRPPAGRAVAALLSARCSHRLSPRFTRLVGPSVRADAGVARLVGEVILILPPIAGAGRHFLIVLLIDTGAAE